MVWVDKEALDAHAIRIGILVPEPPRCFVYIMRSGRYLKIGIAEDVDARRTRLQLSSPFEVSVAVKYSMGDRRYATLAERATHDDLKTYRMHGEWFDVDYHIAMESTEWHVIEARKMRKTALAASKASYAELRNKYRLDREFRLMVDREAESNAPDRLTRQ